jgi:hypothetical protein
MMDFKKRQFNDSIGTMFMASQMASVVGVIISTIICLILIFLFVPGYFQHGIPDNSLDNEPPNAMIGKTGGLSFNVFMSSIFINFCVGSFAAIVLSFNSKRNQKRSG